MSCDNKSDVIPDVTCPVHSTASGLQPTWLALAGFGLATRLVVVLFGCLLAMPEDSFSRMVVDSRTNDRINERHLAALSVGSRRLIMPWYRWDAMWYLDIGQRGYSYRPGAQSSVAFMPLLPLLIKTGTTLGLDRYWLGLLIPNLAFVAGLVFFGRVVRGMTQSAATTWRACILLAAFPSSFYFSAPYQESLGLMFTAGALLAWQSYHPAVAAASLATAATARLTALSMSVGLVLEWMLNVIRGRTARNAAWFVASAGALGTAIFFGYLALRFRDPFLHFKAHGAWQRKSPSAAQLLRTIWSTVQLSAFMVKRSSSFALVLVLLLTWLCQKPLGLAFLRLAGPLLRRRAAPGKGWSEAHSKQTSRLEYRLLGNAARWHWLCRALRGGVV